MKVDFHIHSTASDGTFAPKELIAKASGFSALALTDHDNMDGVGEFVCAAGVAGISVCAGVELSIEPGDGFDKFHLPSSLCAFWCLARKHLASSNQWCNIK